MTDINSAPSAEPEQKYSLRKVFAIGALAVGTIIVGGNVDEQLNEYHLTGSFREDSVLDNLTTPITNGVINLQQMHELAERRRDMMDIIEDGDAFRYDTVPPAQPGSPTLSEYLDGPKG